MPMMGATAAGPGPEAGVYEALAAAVADPKGFAKRLKSLAEETRKHGVARDQAIEAQNSAIEALRGADAARDLAEEAIARQATEDARLADLKDSLEAEKQEFEIQNANSLSFWVGKDAALADREDALTAREAVVQRREDDAAGALKAADAAQAEWTAKRDKLLAAMEK